MSVDDRGRRLVELKDAIKAFFEVTGVVGSGWSAAFQAVRQNDHMAASFLADLRALTDFIEVEFDETPTRRPTTQPTRRVTPVSTAKVAPLPRPAPPAAPARAASKPPAPSPRPMPPPQPAPRGPAPLPRKPTPPPRGGFVEEKTHAVDADQVLEASLAPRRGAARPVPAPPVRPAVAGAAKSGRRFSTSDEVHTNVDGKPPRFDDDADTGRVVTPPPKRGR